MNLMEILQGQLSDDVIGQLSQQIGAEPQQTAAAANGIFGSLLGGLAQNAASPSGLQSLLGALDRDHDGSVLDDVMGLINGGGQGSGATNGIGMLGHILGDRQEGVAQQVSESSGLSMGQVMKLMPVLAPILMGVLGRNKSAGNFGIGDLAGILMGSAQGASQMPGMGNILGSVLGSVLGGNQQPQQQQGGGGMFGNILGTILGGR